MIRKLILSLLLAALTVCGYAQVPEKWVVVGPVEAPADVSYAIADFVTHFKKATGGEISAIKVGETVPEGVGRIEIGTERARQKAIANAKALASGESVAVGERDAVYIWGEGLKGAANGVYNFLEARLGCRWLTPWGDDYVAKCGRFEPGEFVDVNRPSLKVRWILTCASSAMQCSGGMNFLYRNRINCEGFRKLPLTAPDGRALANEVYCPGPNVHGSTIYMPLTEEKSEFKNHPDWYTMNKKGERVDNLQLCFSNPGLREELTRRVLANIAKRGEDGGYDLSQDDHTDTDFCWCKDCKALEAKYGCKGAPMFDYVRSLAGVVAEKYPKARIRFLVYRPNQTQHAPNAAFGRFPANCTAVFAPVMDDFAKDITHENNWRTLEDFRDWRKIVGDICYWGYPMPYGLHGWVPYCGIWRWTKDLKTLVGEGLDGACLEHDVAYPIGFNFTDLQAWMIAKLYENAELRPSDLIRDFCTLYYGAAAKDVMKFLVALETISKANEERMNWNGYLEETIAPKQLLQWDAIFTSAASKVADDERTLQHVNEARQGVDLFLLKRYPQAREVGYELPLDQLYARLTNTMVKAMERRCPNFKQRREAWNPVMKAHKAVMREANVAYLKLTRGTKLPAKYANVPEKDIVEVVVTSGEPMADAAVGVAICRAEDCQDPKGFRCGAYDLVKKKTLADKLFKWSEGKPDEFELYSLGVVEAPRKGVLHLGRSWLKTMKLDGIGIYTPAEPSQWELLVSLKFEGSLAPGSKATANRVWCDRLIFLRQH